MGPVIWGGGGNALNLDTGLQFTTVGPSVLTGTTDPTSVAVSAFAGSIYLNSSNGNVYVKSDNGSTTNWSVIGAGTLGGKYVRTTRFAIIGSGTSGQVTLPSNSTIVLDDFGGTVDAVVLQSSGGFPLKNSAITASGAVVATTFDASGNYSFSGTPSSYPVAIVYRVQQQLTNFDSTAANIWGDSELTGIVTSDLPTNVVLNDISFTIDGGGDVPSTGTKGFIYVPYACTIKSVTVISDQSGSAVIDIWKAAYPSVPSVANTITSSDLPTLSSAQVYQDSTLTGWTTSVNAGDVLGFNLNSASTLTRLNLYLKVQKS